MRSYKRTRRSRSARRSRLGGSTPPPNVEMPNASPNVEMPNAALAPLDGPAPLADPLIREVRNQNALMAPDLPAGRIGLVFNPPPHVQQIQQHAGRKSRRYKSHRRKSHRR